ncbi:MAG: excinuclease ABC subunit UvrA [Planctomycetota bacterium]|nr:excinuclease ABC subunit UvrA [Planctomycetota bacterium]
MEPPLSDAGKTTFQGSLELRGVRTNNLKNIGVSIEHGQIVVVTGPSGCGKSSLAFDTIFAEGKRQFLDSLSIQARQSLQYLPRPNVERITGLQPVVCIDQHKTRPNSRSTVATVTEIYDHLRLLMTRVGTVLCSGCQSSIRQSSTDEIESALLGLPEKTKLVILAPLKTGESVEMKLVEIRKAGFVRARIANEVADLDAFQLKSYAPAEPVDAVIDRVIVKPGIEDRLAESISCALKIGAGSMSVLVLQPGSADWQERGFSTLYCCGECGNSYDEIETRTFSFNSPFGVCPACEGVGAINQFSYELVFSKENVALSELGILSLLDSQEKQSRLDELQSLMSTCGLGPNDPISVTDEASAQLFFLGETGRPGFQQVMEKVFVTTTDPERLDWLAEFRQDQTCPLCQGSRLCEAANHVFLHGRNIGQIVNQSIEEAKLFFREVARNLDAESREIALPIIEEITNRLNFLVNAGAGYLPLARRADSLSGGEFQRVRLATGIGNRLTDVCYILDEPTSGLHPADNQKLAEAIQELKELGNTIMIVEHEPDMMRIADQIIDMGPGAGRQGGEIVYQGAFGEMGESSRSITGQSMSQAARTFSSASTTADSQPWISISGATLNNLQGDEFKFPSGAFVCVSGVSGSGKSSMVHGTLVPAIQKSLGLNRVAGPHQTLVHPDCFSRVVEIDQQPIGRSPRSNAATYTGLLDEIRKIFAATRLAKQRGYKAARFSFNNKPGCCPGCAGHGQKKIEMSFMPDLYVTCETCSGQRFNRATLEVEFKGNSIADVFDLSVLEARQVFENIDKVDRILDSLEQAGLGYLKLGQPATSFSGGEAQRLKIAKFLANPGSGKTLFVLDEPTTGLHFVDLDRLYRLLRGLVEQGNTVLVIEHHLQFLANADYVIDFGPLGGNQGGKIVAQGTPEKVAKQTGSLTGKYLAEWIQG